MLSPTGRCHMWDSSADGYARGEGFAVVVLKRLSQAVTNGDHIECIVRETGVNQDGRSEGLTVPNSTAQTDLIESTYRKCGLDWQKPEHRCQYFEAHGTGTLAGDPKEAQAIRDAFFPTSGTNLLGSYEPLYVGSIKTVMGHAEGAAGLAGILKALLAMKHSCIPPNLHFNMLNPAIKPFYQQLKVPTQLQEWPNLPPGVPRRASVNSFGFGGTNAHAILESWDFKSPNQSGQSFETGTRCRWADLPYGPIVLSAKSESALRETVLAVSQSLKSGDIISLRDLAWTLQCRRDHFSFRTAFTAASRDQLIEKIDATMLDGLQASMARKVSVTHSTRILGVFTGQGAQWPSMGANLYIHSELFRRSILILQDSLDNLQDGPLWSLTGELMAPAETSRLHLAEIAQPLCTAIQIALVDLLKASDVSFTGVVGHSSGEIAAAYAAGYLSSTDAIRIAYYRGLHSCLAQSSMGQPGTMMAVGMSLGEAEGFCQRPDFVGRITVAACNSKSSITISGDADAIDEAKAALDEDKVFARRLQVNKAYHSHHMDPCSKPYLGSLRQCNIQLSRTASEGDCIWYSSVYGHNGRRLYDHNALKDTYWVENMVKPVLFYQSLDRAVQEGQRFDLVLEVGPHPALKGPVLDTLRDLTGVDVPYYGTLSRKGNDLTAISDALGFIWSNIDSPVSMPNFQAFADACSWSHRPQVCKGLPTYQWDHIKPLLRESRISKKWRTRQLDHELLGTPTTYGNNHEVCWRKVMRIAEMEWLRGHQFQGQVVFPAAGYVSMATEAARLIVENEPVRLIELEDLKIHRAITLEEDSSGVAVVFVIKIVYQDATTIRTEYSCYSGDVDVTTNDNEQLNFAGSAIITTGIFSNGELPCRRNEDLPLVDIRPETFYTWISKIGLDYSGDFLMRSLGRRLGFSTVTMGRVAHNKLRLHPATVDTSFHGIFGAFSFPGDDRMWTAYLPTSIKRVRIPMGHYCSEQHRGAGFVGDCHVREGNDKLICADVDIFCSHDNHPDVQIEGLVCSSFKVPSPDEDRKLFAQTVWKRDVSCRIETNDIDSELDNGPPYEVLERISYFYLRKLREEISGDEISTMDWHFQSSLSWAFDRLLPSIASGKHPRVRAEWGNDTQDVISAWEKQYANDINIQLIQAVGMTYPSIARGQIPALQILREGSRLDRFYRDCMGMNRLAKILGSIFDQLSHRYPKLNILEIGAGTGGTTTIALDSLASNFRSYTFTDISAGFFENATSIFAQYGDRMVYKTLNIEHHPLDQGFDEHSFDIVLAANVLHATRSLEETMENCRKLLRPGGYLILLEITSESLWIQLIFSTLPGWWLGQEEGRIDHPTISTNEWNALLSKSGFSGVENCSMDNQDVSKYTMSIMMSQAVDPIVEMLREPLAMTHDMIQVENLVIIGGEEAQMRNEALEVSRLMEPFASNVIVANGLEDPNLVVKLGSSVVCLTDLEEATLKRMTPSRFSAIQSIFNDARRIIWATKGCRGDDPYANIVVGLGRAIRQESPNVSIQFLDISFSNLRNGVAVLLSEALLRMLCRGLPEADNILWTDETEIAVEGDLIYIPRIVPNNTLNDRMNAGRRIIKDYISPATNPVVLTRDSGALMFEVASVSDQSYNTDGLEVRVASSSVFEFSTSDKTVFSLSVGSVLEYKRVLAMAPTASSIAVVPLHQVFEYDQNSDHNVTLQEAIASLICHSLTTNIQGTLWLHGADAHIVNVASKITTRCGIGLFLSSTSSQETGMTFIHPLTTERELLSLIPNDIQRLVIFDYDHGDRFGGLLKSTFGRHMDIQNLGRLAHQASSTPLALDNAMVENILKDISSNRNIAQSLTASTIVKADECTTASIQSPLSIVEWQGVENVLARVKKLDPYALFSGRKTYFLVGLTSEVGLSLCNWMVDNGARYFAITSRTPKLDPRSIRQLERKGAYVNVFALDISDARSLHEVHHLIVTQMPPIAGVVNAAMVLRDKPFSSMSLDDLELVLEPKVHGSKNLDELFYSTKLDFFILFSSLSSLLGNPGQSNYAAAGTFLTSLAAQRRKRGVAASVIDIAMLMGFGYLWRRQDAALESQMRKLGYMALSETDFHAIFAEAIVAGRPHSIQNPVIHTGLAMSSDAPWCQTPRFCHYVSSKTQERKAEKQKDAVLNIREQLVNTCDDGEILLVLGAAFSRKLGIMLQISSNDIDQDMPLVSLGIDSLVAVEIRAWFLKELLVDVPVLKILGGATLTDICIEVRGKVQGLSNVPNSSQRDDAEEGNSTPEHALHTGTGTSTTSTSTNMGEITPDKLLMAVSSNTSVKDDEVPTVQSPTASCPRSYERVGRVSHSQEALHFLHEYLEDKSSQNVTFFGKFHGQLDGERLQKALCLVARRHEALRSSYFVDKSTHQPIQAVNSEPQIGFIQKQIDDERDVQKEIATLKRHTFDIEYGDTMHVTVLSQSPTLHYVIFVHHHIVLDATAWLVFLAELNRAYSGEPFDGPAPQAIDISAKRRSKYAARNLEDELEFWGQVHQTPMEPLPLFPFSKTKSREPLKVYDTETFDIALNNDVSSLIRRKALELQVTPFHFHLSTLMAFLARCLPIDTFNIGIADANRTDDNDTMVMGSYLNVLPLRFQVNRGETFEKATRQTRDTVISALENSRVPFETILDHLRIPRSTSSHPLFQVLVNYRQGYTSETSLGAGKVEWVGGFPPKNSYDLEIDVTTAPNGVCMISFTTQKYMYGASDTQLMMKWYCHALEGFARNLSMELGKCPITNEEEVRKTTILGKGPNG